MWRWIVPWDEEHLPWLLPLPDQLPPRWHEQAARMYPARTCLLSPTIQGLTGINCDSSAIASGTDLAVMPQPRVMAGGVNITF